MIRTRSLLPALVLLAACGGGGDAPKQSDSSEPAAAPAAQATAAPAAGAATGDTITIRMVTTQQGAAGQFEPAQVSARQGDVLHFVADGGAAHNVTFPAAENPGATGLPTTPGTYMVANGQALDIPVTFPPGTYTFVCDPHIATGMKGTLTVTAS